MSVSEMKKTALWAITPNGANLALRLRKAMPGATLCLSESLGPAPADAIRFGRLSTAVRQYFSTHDAHIFIMSTGIVVRMIAPLIRHKTVDPAVVVTDELGLHAISLISGHIGGANALAKQVAEVSGATPVITTATDLNRVPSVDVLAGERHLFIENPTAIRHVSMAFLTGKKVSLYDPYDLLREAIPESAVVRVDADSEIPSDMPGVFIDDTLVDLPPEILVLRPRSLAVGMGCNRNTDMAEMRTLLLETLARFRLSRRSLFTLASVDIKADETGLLALGEDLKLPLTFFDRAQLKQVTAIENPSEMVEKHIGVKSVCEAAAILAAKNGKLIVPKQNTKNVTVAVARKSFTSSASVPAGPTICAGGLPMS
ncbi:cobalamin biosynthesis protein CbiG [Desulfonema ishimotonii]|uniref:Cobalamin biosynthesis protein CbiG n=1 Tax=Desulfonema ishimotonii TaxID=45657 RepID=A0A401G459_9BACT|nr:cobalt-precorrin 5A hydrolase [Desulfonema ishimotonii]GBC64010.1 cobalamin biosynthesis protein CbiG [Desulfonema ishimotonii]